MARCVVMTSAAHSVYSFSSASRWFEDACPASIRLTRGIKDSSNPAAELGTAAHSLGEFCIKFDMHPNECIGMTFGKYSETGEPIAVDLGMVEAVELYYGYVKELSIKTGGFKPMLEMRVAMTSLGRNDVYGTSDLVLFDPRNRTVYISDYKHGYGVVEIDNNKQLIAYAIATLDTMSIWESVDRVVTTIVQPRVQHVNGCIRSQTYTTHELVEWQSRFANSIKLAEDPTSKPVAGEHCTWCRKARCRARFLHVLDVTFPDTPDEELSTGEMGYIYNNLSVIKRFIDRVTDDVIDTARKTGNTPPGTKPVKAIQHARVDNEAALIKDVKLLGVDVETLYKKQLKSKTAVKKLIPANILNKHYKVPNSKITIAKMSDSRPAVRVGSTNGVFAPLTKSTNGVFAPIK